MSVPPELADDEILLRHIPPGTYWQAPGPRIASTNFVLRAGKGETGLSVTRQRITTAEKLLEVVGGDLKRGSRVGFALAGEIRALGLLVEPAPLPDDAGHSEIRPGTATLGDGGMAKRLSKVFQFLPLEDEGPPAAQEAPVPA